MLTDHLVMGIFGLIALIVYERVHDVYMELFKEETEEKVKLIVRKNYWKEQ